VSDEKKDQFPFNEEGFAAFSASLWQPPPLGQRFHDAIPLLAELSGADEEWWHRAMGQSLRYWVAQLKTGMTMDAEYLRACGGGLLATLMLAHLGKAPPPELAREFDRRLQTVREIRHPADDKWMDDDLAEQYWRVWSAIQRVVSAANPEGPKE
jgi:hypothetical protein